VAETGAVDLDDGLALTIKKIEELADKATSEDGPRVQGAIRTSAIKQPWNRPTKFAKPWLMRG